jgi:hypothetical protein
MVPKDYSLGMYFNYNSAQKCSSVFTRYVSVQAIRLCSPTISVESPVTYGVCIKSYNGDDNGDMIYIRGEAPRGDSNF